MDTRRRCCRNMKPGMRLEKADEIRRIIISRTLFLFNILRRNDRFRYKPDQGIY